MDCRDVVVDRFKQSLSTNRESLVEGRKKEKKTIRVNAGENDDFAGAFHCLEVKVFQSLDEMLWQLTSQWLSLSESSLSANRRGEMSDFSSSSTCTLIGIIQIARHASRVGGWDCPSGGKMIGLRRRTEKKNGRITGSERGPLDCCCCFLLFSLLLGLHLLLSISQTSCTPVEQSSWIDYQRGYLNLGRQITRPQSQNHHHHQTFFFPLLFFLFIYPKINRKIDKKGLFNLASFINIFWY